LFYNRQASIGMQYSRNNVFLLQLSTDRFLGACLLHQEVILLVFEVHGNPLARHEVIGYTKMFDLFGKLNTHNM